MIEKFYQVYGHKVCLILPEEMPIYKLQSQVPNIQLIEILLDKLTVKTLPDTITVQFMSHEYYKIIKTDNTYLLFGKWNEQMKGDIPHLLYSVLRQLWVEQEVYAVHSICLNNSLLIGHSGSGKTSLAVEALRKNVSVLSYDKAVLTFNENALQIVAGTQVISMRKELYQKEKQLFLHSRIEENGERFLMTTLDKVYPEIIKNIYLFFITPIDLVVKKLPLGSSMHELYPFFLDTIKTDTIIGNGQFIFNGNNSQLAKETLIQHLNTWVLANNHNVEILIGRKEDIMSYVTQSK